jgi:hypothetical protein
MFSFGGKKQITILLGLGFIQRVILNRSLITMANMPYKLIDIGANLGHPSFSNDIDQVIERAKKSGMHCADASIFCFFYLVICFYSC